QLTYDSPIDKNSEKNIKEIELNLLQIEKIPSKNNFKLFSVVIGFFALIEAIIIIVILSRGHVSKSKKR
ncbi:hypothetical protein, partial [Cetobacterium sp.]